MKIHCIYKGYNIYYSRGFNGDVFYRTIYTDWCTDIKTVIELTNKKEGVI